jgi:hypothetical protein
MAITIISPRFSFVQFAESGTVTSCNFRDINLCLPVYESSDVAFQFVLQTETTEEANELCNPGNENIELSIAGGCDEDNLLVFEEKPQRFRIGERQVLYLWEGLPGFDTVREIGQCFVVRVTVNETEFCSNCFQRIGDTCHTSVIEYSNEENAFGFNYCMSEGEEVDGAVCEPLFITFTNVPTLVIPYTASLLADYGNLPTVQVWIYDTNGELVDMGIRVAFDQYPPTELRFDFGGNASGVIKIS